MRKIVLLIALVIASREARAEVGLGAFFGEPSGFDAKIDLARRSALDILIGWSTFRDGHGAYGHVTYLVTPIVGHGRSVIVPLRLGIGAALYDRGDLAVAGRLPLEIALMFRSAPLEIYGEVAVKVTFVSGVPVDIDGGAGVRFYF